MEESQSTLKPFEDFEIEIEIVEESLQIFGKSWHNASDQIPFKF